MRACEWSSDPRRCALFYRCAFHRCTWTATRPLGSAPCRVRFATTFSWGRRCRRARGLRVEKGIGSEPAAGPRPQGRRRLAPLSPPVPFCTAGLRAARGARAPLPRGTPSPGSCTRPSLKRGSTRSATGGPPWYARTGASLRCSASWRTTAAAGARGGRQGGQARREVALRRRHREVRRRRQLVRRGMPARASVEEA